MIQHQLALICDFDGTITKTDVGHKIYTSFGDDRWEEVNKRWRRGEISSKDCLIGEYSFVDASEDEVIEYVMGMDIDVGFLDIVHTCRDNNIPLAIASDGFDFYIKALLEKYDLYDKGIDIFCSEMEFKGRKVELSFPYYDKGCGLCGNCKKLHVQKFRDEGRKVIYIGDGLSDRFAARSSDVVFAKGELKQYLIESGFSFIEFEILIEIDNWVNDLLTGAIETPEAFFDNTCKDPCPDVVSFTTTRENT
ncbi:HAD-IB family phosphatase [Candidatus Poribacteria bacterium]|nr:HAD-IB family phosphatase [Candidatus Poribacteria bacterium]